MTSKWELSSLERAGRWLSGGTPSKSNPDLWDGSIPWVSPKDMKRPRISDAIDHVAQAAIGNGTQFAPTGSLLMVVRGMILAHTFPVALTTAPVTFNQDIKALVPDGPWSPEFLLYWLQSVAPDVLQLIEVANHGTKRLPSERLFSMEVPHPPLGEQRKIAAILTAVDDAIEATQAVIDQLHVVKKAMMAELLTRGLPGRHTRFKRTAIGELPEAWEVVPLGELIDEGPDNGLYKPQSDYGDGACIVRIDTFDNGDVIDCDDLRRVRVSSDEINRYGLRSNDIVVNRVNSLSHIAKSAIVGSLSEPTVFESNMMRFSVAEQRLLPSFAFRVISSPAAKAYFVGRAKQAVAQASINQGDVRALPVPLPPLPEQADISNIADMLELRLTAENQYRDGLAELKVALMSVLLIGEVRVTPGDEVA